MFLRSCVTKDVNPRELIKLYGIDIEMTEQSQLPNERVNKKGVDTFQ